MARTVRCMSCGHKLSRYAARCPNCGAAQPHKRMGSTLGLGLMLVLLALALLWAVTTAGA